MGFGQHKRRQRSTHCISLHSSTISILQKSCKSFFSYYLRKSHQNIIILQAEALIVPPKEEEDPPGSIGLTEAINLAKHLQSKLSLTEAEKTLQHFHKDHWLSISGRGNDQEVSMGVRSFLELKTWLSASFPVLTIPLTIHSISVTSPIVKYVEQCSFRFDDDFEVKLYREKHVLMLHARRDYTNTAVDDGFNQEENPNVHLVAKCGINRRL